ncbi:MAG: DUF2207 domain-containing protein [Caldilineaceae bacterium]
MKPINRRIYLHRLILSVVLFLLPAAYPVSALAQSAPPLTYERYDSEITVQEDGTFLVREVQQIRFDDVFQTAFAEIPAELTTAIDSIQLYEDDQPYREGSSDPGGFTAYRDGDVYVVEWNFAPTNPGDVRTFTLEYVVQGGLWIYPDEQVLEWRAVPADRSGITVEASTVTVTVPPAVSQQQVQYTAYGPSYTTEAAADQVIFTATEPLPDGVAFQVQVGMPANATQAAYQPWQANEDRANLDYRFGNFDVELTMDRDGALWVEERQLVNVSAGALDQGYRTISNRFLDTIDEITLNEGDQSFTESNTPCDYCFQVSRAPRRADWVTYDPGTGQPVVNESRAGSVTITWQFPPLVRGETTTFTLRYRVQGALQLLPDGQRLNWTAIFADHAAPVTAASLQLQLPATVSTAEVMADGGAVERVDDNTMRVVAPTAIAPGRPWEVYFSFPPTAFEAPMSTWQTELEAAVADAANAATQRARGQLFFGGLAAMLALLGPLGVYLLWYTRGRDLPVPAIADYLTEPPSDLPPAIVAYLLDEEPSTKGALASIFHLATIGLLSVRFDNTVALKRLYDGDVNANEELVTPEGFTVRVPQHLATLFNALKPELPLNQEVSLNQLYRTFHQQLPTIYAQMGEEATHFFDELPPTARRRWLVRGQWIVILALIAAVLLAMWYVGTLGWVAVLPALALVITGGVLMMVSRWMPRRTNVGVEEAQRWRAFRTYLRNLKKYGSVEDAQRILDRYFAYAVAFDVEEVVLQQTEELGGHLPPWTYTPTWEPYRRPYRRTDPQRGSPSTTIPTGLPDPGLGTAGQPPSAPSLPSERPSLSGMSRHLGNALDTASSSLGSLLTQAVGPEGNTPFDAILQGSQSASRTGGKVASTTLEILGEILAESASGGGSGGYRSSGSARSSWSSSSSRRSSGGFSSGRSSSSRRSGGGGRRGFR